MTTAWGTPILIKNQDGSFSIIRYGDVRQVIASGLKDWRSANFFILNTLGGSFGEFGQNILIGQYWELKLPGYPAW